MSNRHYLAWRLISALAIAKLLSFRTSNLPGSKEADYLADLADTANAQSTGDNCAGTQDISVLLLFSTHSKDREQDMQ
jgi:hypothetical protein